jgi:hypothetical protein
VKIILLQQINVLNIQYNYRYVLRTVERRGAFRVVAGKRERKSNFEDLGLDGNLSLIIKTLDV